MNVPGIPEEVRNTTLLCPPNDIDAVETLFKTDKDIACIILEPPGAAFGIVPTNGTVLKQLREVTEAHGVLLIFDEVITGFRVAPGGAQAHYNVTPDMTTLAKILAGGLPGGALAGKREVLELISMKSERDGLKMPHPGTFNANPLSAAAGIAMLNIIKTGEPHKQANHTAARLRTELNGVIDDYELDWVVYGEFSGIKLLVGHGEKGMRTSDFDPYTWEYRKLKGSSDSDLLMRLRCGLLLNGIDLASNGGMTTAAHTEEDVTETVAAFAQTLEWLKAEKAL